MENSERNQVVDILKRYGNGDAWVTHTFGFVRTSDKRSEHIVNVEVYERISGPGNRFSVVATDENGRQASGNSADKLDVVLATVHWEDLDK
jgi:hypothetical protein